MGIAASILLIALMSTEETLPCGADAIASCLQCVGDSIFAAEAASLLPRGGVDASFLELKTLAEKRGIFCRAVHWGSDMPQTNIPSIVQVVLPSNRTHFIAVLEKRGNQVLIAERSQARWVPAATLRAAQWNGTALHFSRSQINLVVMGRFWQAVVVVATVLATLVLAVIPRKHFGMLTRLAIPRTKIPAASKNPHGVTLIEVLVTLGIISLLLSLLSPAIQSARERARSMTCANHLKQFGLAMQNSESTFGQFPPFATRDIQARVGNIPIPFAVSPHFNLLPYLDLANVQSRIELTNDVWSLTADPPTSQNNSALLKSINIPVFICPSDRRVPGSTNYVMCTGTSTDLHITPDVPVPNSSRAGFGRTGRGPRAADVSDGLSTTIAFSERLIGGGIPTTYIPSRDIAIVTGVAFPRLPDDAIQMCEEHVTLQSQHSSFNGVGWLFGIRGVTMYNQISTPNSASPDCAIFAVGDTGVYTARSLHRSGCFILLGDGAVRFTSESIDQSLWRALGTTDSADFAELP